MKTCICLTNKNGTITVKSYGCPEHDLDYQSVDPEYTAMSVPPGWREVGKREIYDHEYWISAANGHPIQADAHMGKSIRRIIERINEPEENKPKYNSEETLDNGERYYSGEPLSMLTEGLARIQATRPDPKPKYKKQASNQPRWNSI